MEEVQAEKQVILHCRYTCSYVNGMYIRVWPSTFLMAKDVMHSSDLVLAENIPMAPDWQFVRKGQTVQFTLIFSGLPGPCQSFDLVEILPQEGGFFVPGIKRNETDVYEVTLSDEM